MSDTANPTPDWYPDPTGRFEQRYWDGSQWTEHVNSAGQQRTDPLSDGPAEPQTTADLPGLGDAAPMAEPTPPVEPEPVAGPTPEASPPPDWSVAEPAVAPPLVPEPVAAAESAPDWHPDPTGRYEQRYWDGSQWSEHVMVAGQQGVDPLPDESGEVGDPTTDDGGEADSGATSIMAAAAVPEPDPSDEADGLDDDETDEDPPDDGGPGGPGPGPAPEPAPQPGPAAAGPAPDWYPDPTGRQEQRYWDGTQWTEHASSGGRPVVDPIDQATSLSLIPAGDQDATAVQLQVQQQAGAVAVADGGGTLFTEPILVVNQKWKVVEINNEYAVYDRNGNQIGAVRQVGQSTAKKVARVLTSLDQFMTHSLQVVDMAGHVQLTMTRPAKFVKSRVEIGDSLGRPVGSVVQQNAIGKIRFSLEAEGRTYGSINAENWRAWNFNIQDHTGAEVARITKTWEGLAKTMFTTADNYVLQINHPLEDPLRSLVVASALCVDTALKQDNRGLG